MANRAVLAVPANCSTGHHFSFCVIVEFQAARSVPFRADTFVTRLIPFVQRTCMKCTIGTRCYGNRIELQYLQSVMRYSLGRSFETLLLKRYKSIFPRQGCSVTILTEQNSSIITVEYPAMTAEKFSHSALISFKWNVNPNESIDLVLRESHPWWKNREMTLENDEI